MKKLFAGLLVIAATLATLATLALLLLAFQPWRQAASAQDGPYIAATILERRSGWAESNLIEGTDCSFTGERFGAYNSNRMHIVVRDERSRVIAVEEVRGVISANVEFDFYTCEAIFEMSLPAADFYTVHVNDTYYVTVSGDDLNYIPLDIVRENEEDWHPVIS